MTKAMDYKSCSEITGLAERTLRNMVSQKKIPFYKIGKSVRFSQEKISVWLEEHAVEPLSKSLNGRA